MKLRFSRGFWQRGDDQTTRRPGHVFGGRVRVSTLVLIAAFLAVWWVYDTYGPQDPGDGGAPTQVVPPGFVPDPNYTWVPRTRVQQPPPMTTTTVSPTSEPSTPPETPIGPPLPFELPPPFGPDTPSPPAPPPPPEPGPAPSATP